MRAILIAMAAAMALAAGVRSEEYKNSSSAPVCENYFRMREMQKAVAGRQWDAVMHLAKDECGFLKEGTARMVILDLAGDDLVKVALTAPDGKTVEVWTMLVILRHLDGSVLSTQEQIDIRKRYEDR